MGKTIDIGGRIHNPEVGNVVTGANEILDDTKNKKQDVINSEVDAALEALDANKQDNLTFDQTPTESSTNPVTSGGVYAADAVLQQAIEAILTLIPSAASALNQLTDKSFVNSSIATASATFRGTYNLVSDLHLSVTASHQDIATALASAVSTADNNDYCFVQIPTSDTSSDIRVTERYKFNGTAWQYEYDLNNSGFTATQWEAINSGITALLVTKLGALPTAAELATSLSGKQNVLTFDNVPVSGSDNPVKSGGLFQLFTAIDAKFPSDASSNNKLVAENRLAAYVTAIIEALDASFDLTSADGHVTFRMTQTNGVIASVQILTSDIASASQVSTNTADIAYLKNIYQTLIGQSNIIIVEGALPSSGLEQGKVYRQVDQTHTPPQYYSDYMYNGTNLVLMATYNNAIDAIPTLNSENLVESGGVERVKLSKVLGKNKLNPDTCTPDKYVNRTDGSIGSLSGKYATDFIEISGVVTCNVAYAGGAAIGYACYDSNKHFTHGGTSDTISYQTGDKYVRFTLNTTVDAQVEEGASKTNYVPYNETNFPYDGKNLYEDSVGIKKLSGITAYKGVSDNILDPSTLETGKYVQYTTGLIFSGNYAITPYIPIDRNGLYCNCVQSGGNAIGYALYNDNKEYVSGGYSDSISYVNGAAYVRITINTSVQNKMLCNGTDAKAYVPYAGVTRVFKQDLIPVIGFDKVGFKAVTPIGKNLLNPNEVLENCYIDRFNGNVMADSGQTLDATGYILVSKEGLYFNALAVGGTSFGGAVYDINKTYIRGITNNVYTYQEGDMYVRYSFYKSNLSTAQVEVGSAGTSYEAFEGRETIDPAYLPLNSESGEGGINALDLALPEKFYAVVGDTLQIFYKGIIKAVDALNYNIAVNCPIGNVYHRYYECTPSANQVGEYNFNVIVRDDNANTLANKSCKLVVVNTVQSPASNKNVLCVGDSLTANGIWPAEASRRLIGTGGTPEGKGLSNIHFVGSMTRDGAGYLGKSGWGWGDFCTQGRAAFRFTIGSTPTVNIGSVYSNNGFNYEIIEINAGTILCATSSRSNVPEASGTLTKVSGGGSESIAFSASSQDTQNPFWDYDNSEMTFVPYVDNYCNSSIDVMYVLLGANGSQPWQSDFTTMMGYVKLFADTLHSEYPNCKLKLMGMHFASCLNMVPGYGANNYADPFALNAMIYNINEEYKKFVKLDDYKDWVEYVDIASQFDSDYNYPLTEKDVNTRNSSKTEPYANNTLHPGTTGYLQFADTVYRNAVNELCQL